MLARLNNQGAAADGLTLSLPIHDFESSLASPSKINFQPKTTPSVRKTKNMARKIKNKIRATLPNATDVRLKPKRPTKIEIRKKISAHLSICIPH
jgi:hypothetical protein